MTALERWYPGDQIVAGLILVAVAVAVISTAALLATWRMNSRPALRHSVLFSALLCALATPGLAAALVQLDVVLLSLPLFSTDRRDATVVTTQAVGAEPQDRRMADAPWSAEKLRGPGHFVNSADRPDGAVQPPMRESALANSAGRPEGVDAPAVGDTEAAVPNIFLRRAATGAIFVWISGTVLLFIGIARSYVRLHRLRRHLLPAPNEQLPEILKEVQHLLNTSRMPQVAVSERILTPVAAGWFRPVIILPQSSLPHISRDQLCDVLVHEMAHVLRGDHLVVPLQLVAKALFWPIAVIHLLNRQLGCAREEVCDNFVLVARDAVSYGETLLHLAHLARGARPLAATTGILHSRGQLETRIAGLLDGRRNRTIRARQVIGVAVFLLFSLASAALCSTKLVVADGAKSPRLISVDTKPAETKSTGQPTERPKSPEVKEGARKVLEPTFVMADHVIIYENRVIARKDIPDLLKRMASERPIYPRFMSPPGSLEQLKERQQQISEMMEKAGFRAYSSASLGSRASARYDAVRTQKDLDPDASKKRPGKVFLVDGSPAEGAEVVLLPNEPRDLLSGEILVYVNDGRVRSPIEEILTRTDAAGNFAIYPDKPTLGAPSNRSQLLVLHKTGFASLTSDDFAPDLTITLKPWVRISGTIDRRGEPKQKVLITTTLPQVDGWPRIQLADYEMSVAEDGSFDRGTIAPGDIVVQRSAPNPSDEGESNSFTVGQISGAKPGSEHRVVIGPLTAAKTPTAIEASLYGTWTWSGFLVHGTMTFLENGTYRYEFANQPKETRITGKWRIENQTELVYETPQAGSKPVEETRWRIVSVNASELKLQPLSPGTREKTVTYTRAPAAGETGKTAPAESPKAGSPKKEETPKKEKDAKKENESGSNLLKRIREAGEPILAEMAEKHGYGLAAGQSLKRVAPPFSPLRMEYYRVGNPSQFEAIPAGPSAMTFRWDGKRLRAWSMTFGDTTDPGYNLTGALDALHEIKSQQVEGSDALLRTRIAGDWVVRPGLPDEKFAQELQTILQNDLKLPIRLEFRMVDRDVYVARGRYRFTPLPGQPKESKTHYENETVSDDPVQIFGKELVPNSGAGGGTGDFHEFLQWLGRWIESPIVDETTERPQRKLSWTLHAGHDPELVLPNIEAQTGLKFTKESRKVKILFVEAKK